VYIQFLVEDVSGEKLINAVMTKYKEESPYASIDYDIKSYKGIGHFKKGKDALAIKSEKLLNDLPKRIRAFNIILRDKANASLFVIVDNDRRKTDVFRKQLEETASCDNISLDRVFCIAIEEIEAWLLGDVSAIKNAYPTMKDRISQKHPQYKQDEIRNDGTWEFLLELLNTPKRGRAKKEHLAYADLGKLKSEWADRIGVYMNIRENASPSFNYFICELDKRKQLIFRT
jgi:hypothetical protein